MEILSENFLLYKSLENIQKKVELQSISQTSNEIKEIIKLKKKQFTNYYKILSENEKILKNKRNSTNEDYFSNCEEIIEIMNKDNSSDLYKSNLEENSVVALQMKQDSPDFCGKKSFLKEIDCNYLNEVSENY